MLKTRMEGSVVSVNCQPEDITKLTLDLGHDSAYAHALVIAMDECSTNMGGKQYRDSVLGRALDLMESWGYVGEGNGSR